MLDLKILQQTIETLKQSFCESLPFSNNNQSAVNLLLQLNLLFMDRLRSLNKCYWICMKQLSPKFVIENVECHCQKWQHEKLRDYTWLHIILNESLLEIILTSIYSNRTLLYPYYYSDSILFTKMEILEKLASELSFVLFAFPLTKSWLDQFDELNSQESGSNCPSHINKYQRGSEVYVDVSLISHKTYKIMSSLKKFMTLSPDEDKGKTYQMSALHSASKQSTSSIEEFNLIDFNTDAFIPFSNTNSSVGDVSSLFSPVDPWDAVVDAVVSFSCTSSSLVRHNLSVSMEDDPIEVFHKPLRSSKSLDSSTFQCFRLSESVRKTVTTSLSESVPDSIRALSSISASGQFFDSFHSTNFASNIFERVGTCKTTDKISVTQSDIFSNLHNQELRECSTSSQSFNSPLSASDLPGCSVNSLHFVSSEPRPPLHFPDISASDFLSLSYSLSNSGLTVYADPSFSNFSTRSQTTLTFSSFFNNVASTSRIQSDENKFESACVKQEEPVLDSINFVSSNLHSFDFVENNVNDVFTLKVRDDDIASLYPSASSVSTDRGTTSTKSNSNQNQLFCESPTSEHQPTFEFKSDYLPGITELAYDNGNEFTVGGTHTVVETHSFLDTTQRQTNAPCIGCSNINSLTSSTLFEKSPLDSLVTVETAYLTNFTSSEKETSPIYSYSSFGSVSSDSLSHDEVSTPIVLSHESFSRIDSKSFRKNLSAVASSLPITISSTSDFNQLNVDQWPATSLPCLAFSDQTSSKTSALFSSNKAFDAYHSYEKLASGINIPSLSTNKPSSNCSFEDCLIEKTSQPCDLTTEVDQRSVDKIDEETRDTPTFPSHFSLLLMVNVFHSDQESILEVIPVPFEETFIVITDTYIYIVYMDGDVLMCAASFANRTTVIGLLVNNQGVSFSTNHDDIYYCYTADPVLTRHFVEVLERCISLQQRPFHDEHKAFIYRFISEPFDLLKIVPIKSRPDPAACQSGMLKHEMKRLFKKWSWSFFYVEGGVLYQYNNKDTSKPSASYVLMSSFEAIKTNNLVISIKSDHHEVIKLQTASKEEADQWLETIRWNIRNPCNRFLPSSLVSTDNHFFMLSRSFLISISRTDVIEVKQTADCDVLVRLTGKNFDWLVRFFEESHRNNFCASFSDCFI